MLDSLIEVLTKRISHMFYKFMDVHYETNVISESISSIGISKIVNRLGKHEFFMWVGSK